MNDRDRVTLPQARNIAAQVRHRHGGTDQALARLDEEITRQEQEATAVRAEILVLLDDLDAAYPTDIIPEPPPGQHGSVDGCSARAARNTLRLVREDVLRMYARRAAPADACRACSEQVPGLYLSELMRRRWEREGGPMTPGERSHWSVQADEKSNGTLHTFTFLGVCGARFSYQVDSGD